jgi:hypothetical protein
MKPKIRLRIFLTSMLALALIIACGGGGGGDGTSTSSSGETGSVALFITDAPTMDYDEIVLTVSKVTLIPPESEPERSEVSIFPSSEFSDPIKIRLLNLQDQDFLLNVNHNVPVGRYEKIRLYVEKVTIEGGECEDKKVKLPSNKLDLNPRGIFEIKAGEVKSIRIDVDAEKSTLLVNNPVMCILRPVAFVEIDTFVERCPRILAGTITAIFGDNGTPTGFAMELNGGRGTLDVLLDRGGQATVIFDEFGKSVKSDALAIGQDVKVRGRLDRNADLLASAVVIGDVLNLDGTVAGSVNGSLQFNFEIDPGQSFVGISDQSLTVQLTEPSLILAGCDTEVGSDAIQEGIRATVVGKYNISNNLFVAVAVLLREAILAGDLVGIAPFGEDYLLTIRTASGKIEEVILPSTEPVLLQNDGVVPFDLLDELVGCRTLDPLQVKIVMDPDKAEQTALEVRVQAESIFGTVLPFETTERTLLVEMNTEKIFVGVEDSATILEFVENDPNPDELRLVDFTAIQDGDELSAFGLRRCPNDKDLDFSAFVLVSRNIEK